MKRRIAEENLAELYQHLGGEAMGGYMIAEVIEGLWLDAGHSLQVNTANDCAGAPAIAGLPAGAFVEAPAIIDRQGVHPKKVGTLPTGVTALLSHFFAQQQLIVQAALEGDRQAIVQALLLDPSLRRLEHAGEIADRMLAAHGQYLPMFAA
ncbi:MAG: hypothetical protein ACUVWR_11440 [Anaerolineae bacterium]